MNVHEKFSPLMPEEIAAAPAITKQVRDNGEIVAPVPLDAPLLGVKFNGRKPDEVFWFVNEKGGRLFAECRWNLKDGAKEVRPACFTDHGWKLVAYPALRPIYNLDKLADSPDSPVWLSVFVGIDVSDRTDSSR
jgi:hypothetical protein